MSHVATILAAMKESSLWLRLGVWWLVSTALYWVLALMGYGWTLDCLTACTAVVAPDSAWWFNLLGLFVPLNPNNASLLTVFVLKPVMLAFPMVAAFLQAHAYALTAAAAAITLILGIGVTRILERALWHLSLGPALKVLANLIILLALTAVGDLLVFGGHLVSLEILKQSL